jgi:hypothetical protein
LKHQSSEKSGGESREGENERKMIKDRFILMIFCCQNYIPLRDKNINVQSYQVIRALISHIVLDIQSNVSGRQAT